MNSRNFVWPVVVGFAFISGNAWQVGTGQDPKPKSVQQWEHRATRDPRDLDKLGDEGWELVATAALGDRFTTLYFKRPK